MWLIGNVESLKHGQTNTLAAAGTESQAVCAERMLILLFHSLTNTRAE